MLKILPSQINCWMCISQRWIIVLLCFLGLFTAFAMRVSFAIAITEMVALPNETNSNFAYNYLDGNKREFKDLQNGTTINSKRFNWSESTQGLILSSFYWGYSITTILGGLIATKFGSKYSMSFAVASTSVLTILTPTVIEWGGSTALILLRILMGLGEGTMYPSINFLLARWIPKTERSRTTFLSFAGINVGAIIGLSVSGVILKHSGLGWPTVFYAFGGFGIFSFLLICAFCYNQPSESPFISEAEEKFLKDSIEDTHINVPPVPWHHILRSKPVWALLAAMNGKAWGLLVISSDMPKYMSSVLKLPPDQNGYLNSIANLCSFVTSCFVSWIADNLIIRGLVSTVLVRKIGTTVSLFVSGIFLVAIPYAGNDITSAMFLYIISWMLFGFCNFSMMANTLDLSPNYSGILLGTVFGISTISGSLSPYLVGYLTPNQTLDEWRSVFWIVFVIYAVSNVSFFVYGSADVQEWNDPKFLDSYKKIRKSEARGNVLEISL